MIDFIPLDLYAKIFYYFLLFVILIVFLNSFKSNIQEPTNLRNKSILGLLILVVIILYIGLRPISGLYFGDMLSYSRTFDRYALGESLASDRDLFFEYFTKFCAKFLTEDFYFLILFLLYIIPFYLVSKTFFKDYWFYAFLIFISSFTFWGSATNGIRNGIATSFFLLAIAQNKRNVRYLLLIVAISFHKSLLIPTFAYFLALYYTNSKHYLTIWLVAIPVSLVAGSVFENFFLNFGFGAEDRLEGYLTELDEGIANSKLGFRWDFILYSAAGVFAGYYYIYKKKFEDKFYSQLLNMYLIANTFWILIIKANFSNRFAYLSWFMLPLVIIYPVLKKEMFKNQHQTIGKIILAYYMFTYILNVILA